MTGSGALRELATKWGVTAEYHDALGVHRVASDEAVVAILRSLGAPLERVEDASSALEDHERSLCHRGVEPVLVGWERSPEQVRVRLPEAQVNGRARVAMWDEGGGRSESDLRVADLSVVGERRFGGERFVELSVPLPASATLGYGRVVFEGAGFRHEAAMVVAPRTVYRDGRNRTWGAFVPTYALRSERTLGVGDLGALHRVADELASVGGGLLGTLPLLSTFLEEPFEPSPYVPVSRLFWNELFLDAWTLPELEGCPEARSLLASDELATIRLNHPDLTDYRVVAGFKRRVLALLAERAFAEGVPPAVQQLLSELPELDAYARFRAAVESGGLVAVWDAAGLPRELGGQSAESAYRYHLYVQWRVRGQLAELGASLRAHGPGLYLDLPLGVHRRGFDAWRYPASFLSGVSAGAPPDPLFTGGQCWGFAPLHPEGVRRDGLQYVIESLRAQMRYAGVLRLDHVMWMHRIFCVPDGMEATQGVYVHYRTEELYAALCLESQRAGTAVVGEDLGTVPDEVRRSMSEHGVMRMYVAQFELEANAGAPVHPQPSDAVATVNTHDTPLFGAFWRGRDSEDRRELGLLDEEGVARELHQRRELCAALSQFFRDRGCTVGEDDPFAVMAALYGELAEGPAHAVLVTLEDLWLEERPQNVPGTGHERPNWRRRCARSVEAIFADPNVRRVLQTINQRRRNA